MAALLRFGLLHKPGLSNHRAILICVRKNSESRPQEDKKTVLHSVTMGTAFTLNLSSIR